MVGGMLCYFQSIALAFVVDHTGGQEQGHQRGCYGIYSNVILFPRNISILHIF